jgi:branched-chain amino acid aminotransferase
MGSPKQVWLNGEFVDADRAAVSVFDHGLLYGDGVFEGIRAYGGRILKLQTHLNRLFAGAEAIKLAIPHTAEVLSDAIRKTVKANGATDGYIRLVVSRGPGTLGLNPCLCTHPNVFVIADQIKLYPTELYENGMAIITANTIRNHAQALDPAVKSLNYLNNIRAKIEAVAADVLEALMLNHEGNVAECTGDNIFMIQSGRLITPPASAGILPGITRGLVLALAREAGIETAEQDFTLETLYDCDEVFLTGTAAEVIPVTRIDERVIDGGKPGQITLQLIEAFGRLVADAPED